MRASERPVASPLPIPAQITRAHAQAALTSRSPPSFVRRWRRCRLSSSFVVTLRAKTNGSATVSCSNRKKKEEEGGGERATREPRERNPMLGQDRPRSDGAWRRQRRRASRDSSLRGLSFSSATSADRLLDSRKIFMVKVKLENVQGGDGTNCNPTLPYFCNSRFIPLSNQLKFGQSRNCEWAKFRYCLI